MNQVKTILLLTTTVATLVGYGFIAWKFYGIGSKVTEHAALEQGAKNEKNYEKIKQEVLSLNDNDLRREYCKWVRDDRDLCLQNNKPLE